MNEYSLAKVQLLIILLACTGCKITKKNQNWEYLTSRKKICQ